MIVEGNDAILRESGLMSEWHFQSVFPGNLPPFHTYRCIFKGPMFLWIYQYIFMHTPCIQEKIDLKTASSWLASAGAARTKNKRHERAPEWAAKNRQTFLHLSGMMTKTNPDGWKLPDQ